MQARIPKKAGSFSAVLFCCGVSAALTGIPPSLAQGHSGNSSTSSHSGTAGGGTGGNYSPGGEPGTACGAQQLDGSAGGRGYPIGTSTTSGVPPAMVWGLGGIYSGNGYSLLNGTNIGQFGYYNNAGIGYYDCNPLAPQFPVYPAPVALGDNYFAFGGLNARLGYWRASSGYYYPWCPRVYLPGAVYPSNQAVYTISQGVIQQVKPPMAVIFADMHQFIEDAHSKHQLSVSAYEHIFNTLNGIESRATQLGSKNAGIVDSSDEADIRRELDLLSAEISRSMEI